ncbi:MAG: DUF5979 domain-containing protein [Solobacterium sp.]|nr:DUF5979 domain-containing protein [Solobacterium sp.]
MNGKWMKAVHILTALLLTVCVMPKGYVKAVDVGMNKVDVLFTGNEDDIADFEGVSASVDFYKLADAVKDPVYDTYGYDFKKGFENLMTDEELKNPTAEVWKKACDRAASLIFGDFPADITPLTRTFPLKSGEKCELESGLYLIIAHDDEGTPKKSDDGVVRGSISTKMYKYVYSPVLVSMPSKTGRTDELAHTGIGEWTNEITVVLKPEKELMHGQLKIVKSVRTFESRTDATFAFKVDAWMPEDVDSNGNPTKYCYNNAVSMTFSANDLEDQFVILDGIPVGAVVEVTEVYTGASYKLVNTTYSNENHVITIEDILTVTFENEHTHEDRTGYGVNNHFDKVDDNWIWLDPKGGDEE